VLDFGIYDEGYGSYMFHLKREFYAKHALGINIDKF